MDRHTRSRRSGTGVMMTKKHLLLALRVLFAVAGLTYIVLCVQWADQPAVPDMPGRPGKPATPGIVTVLAGADLTLLAAGLLMAGVIFPIQTFRWWLLMRCRGLQVTLYKSFRLMMVGCFFNYAMPVGLTGGDVVKAYYAAKNSGRRADAVMSVLFDRVTGMLGLILLAGVAGLFMLDHEVARQITGYVWLGAAGLAVAALLYFWPPLRRLLRVERILRKLPGARLFTAVDQATVAYGRHKRTVLIAVLISVPVHLLLALATTAAGYAMGMTAEIAPPGFMLTAVPVICMAGALPLSPQGIGVMEWVAMALIPDASFNQIVGMLMALRLFQAFWAMGGSLFLLRGDIHLHPEAEQP